MYDDKRFTSRPKVCVDLRRHIISLFLGRRDTVRFYLFME